MATTTVWYPLVPLTRKRAIHYASPSVPGVPNTPRMSNMMETRRVASFQPSSLPFRTFPIFRSSGPCRFAPLCWQAGHRHLVCSQTLSILLAPQTPSFHIPHHPPSSRILTHIDAFSTQPYIYIRAPASVLHTHAFDSIFLHYILLLAHIVDVVQDVRFSALLPESSSLRRAGAEKSASSCLLSLHSFFPPGGRKQ